MPNSWPLSFDVAYHIIGGGEEGDKTVVRTKEEADHSLQYMTAAALLDGQVLPEQYLPERIQRNDVQTLLKKIQLRPSELFSSRFPNEMPCRLRIHMKDNRVLEIEKKDYEGFHTRPMSWQTVFEKFERLAEPYTDNDLRGKIFETVRQLENHSLSDVTALLAQVKVPV